ncbi:LLM class F420-dependent oxidoreductase [Reticulibacter mediterranei]|uniref:LLM class F420-dependent oxidoreductase n=1 Tax=Reticulibacter mediterranei TaxID=2778369 RepID=A0A8J3IHM9_9CHLR|nr:LLM class flavin-dependent oxidoreductase [Reticulibacter mediterranei]GHO93813.1 LLM class F420-dependent oxidoreductase [Reticulibacter mediterranei]
MANIEFGLIIRPSTFTLPINPYDLHEYNCRCIQAVSQVFTTIWVEDHLQWGNDVTLECFTTMSYLAAMFPHFRIGSIVLSQSYRNPALVAKMIANLHFLSGGRCILGIGAGWKADEHIAYGYPMPDKERWEQLEEAIVIIRSMWMEQAATFVGKHYQIHNVYCEPRPSPSIPLLIGGGGERRTLPLVARYADWWNYNSCPVEEYAHKVAVLKEHCRRIGRDFAEITLTYSGTVNVSEDPAEIVSASPRYVIAGTSSEVIERLNRYCDVGVRHLMLRFSGFQALEHFVATVAPHFM